MIRFLKVTGDSLAPEYRTGDFVIVAKVPCILSTLHEGDIVIFKHPLHGTLMKRVHSINNAAGTAILLGTNENSIDSRNFGAVRLSSINGKVIHHLPRSR
jgi:phage repressor protein C with HTH and peptisase S24 domain